MTAPASLSAPRPLRVLQVYRTYFPDPQGGLQEAIRQICLATQPHNVVHRVFTLSPQASPPVISRTEADVYRVPQHFEIASSGFSLTALPTFRRLCAWADVVHYHFPWPFADMLHMMSRVEKPMVVTYHSDIVRQQGWLHLYQPVMRRFLASADRLVATSPAYAASSPLLQRYRQRVEVIPFGLDESSCTSPTTASQRAAERAHGRDFFLFVGVLRYYKGLETLLEAVRGTDLRVVIAGAGPEEQRLKRMARAASLDNVHFAGFVSDELKAALFRHCRAVVFPSNARSEAFGFTLLEGAMWGRPLICTDIDTGTTFVNRDGETGLVVPVADPQALRRAMQRLQDDPELAQRLGEGARRRFEAVFDSTEMGRRYARLYRDLSTPSVLVDDARRPAGG